MSWGTRRAGYTVEVTSQPRSFTDRVLHPGRRLRDVLDDVAEASPARLAMASFIVATAVFTVLLSLPIAHQNPGEHSFANSLFVAVSTICVTGLSPVVTEEYWTTFGHWVMVASMQVGGLGILTLASLLGMAVSKRLGVRQRLIAAQATNTFQVGQVGTLMRAVIITSLSVEAVIMALLLPRFLQRGDSFGDALWHSIFYAVSSFNNAGFTLHSGGAVFFSEDPWILMVVMISMLIGSLGFPVVLMVAVTWNRPRGWDLHTKLTLATTGILFVLSFALLYLFESSNERTIGGMSFGHGITNTLFMAAMPRSGGMASVDVSDMHGTSHLLIDVLMFIGGGSSSTAGGIKVTTIAVLVLAALAEARGLKDVTVFHRRIDPATVRVAISITLAGTGLVLAGTLALLHITRMPLDAVLFDAISAFATCGMSSGVTEQSPAAGLYVLSALMFLGRLGTITLAASLSTSHQQRLFRYPEERPIIG